MKQKKKEICRSVCPIANALDILGDRWTLLVIRDMMFFGRHEFHEFMGAGEGISTNILADRLKRLMEQGIIALRPYPANKTRKFYYLTKKGKDLLPTMIEMVSWAGEYLEATRPVRAKIEQMRKNPRQFVKKTLQDLEAWEKVTGTVPKKGGVLIS